MAKTSSRKTKKNPDFKRIKAKVGKRAIKPANVTDTTFRTASLQVRKQQVGTETTPNTASDAANTASTDPATMAVLYSAKGKSLQELTAQLSHPASNVRVSAIKGMNAIVNDFPHVFVSRYYYLLFPAMAKCLVDLDTTARQLSRNLLRDVLRQAGSPLQRASLRPYIPLLVAYILSALNSLDRPTRMDGAKSLIILFEQQAKTQGGVDEKDQHGDEGDEGGEITGGGGLVEDDDLGRLLPALVGLMAMDPHQQHPSQPQAQQATKAKNSKKTLTMESERCIIIQSLVSVLKGVPSSSGHNLTSLSSSKRGNLNTANASQVKGGSVVLLRRHHTTASQLQQPRASLPKLTSILDLSPFDDDQELSSGVNTMDESSVILLPTSATIELVTKLCDHLVETTQAGGQDDLVGMDQVVRRANNMIGKVAAEELYLVVTAVSLVWKTLGLRGFQKQEELLKGIKQWRQLVALLLEIFPIVSQDHQSRENGGVSLCDRLNLTICTTVMEISSALIQFDEEDESSSWMGPILEYLLPRVEQDSDAARHKASVVHVLARLLLLRRGQNGPLLLSSKTHQTILQTLQTFLFGSTDKMVLDENRTRSPAGRRVAQLVRDMVTELCNLDPFTSPDDKNDLNKRLLAMLFQMPNVLTAWRGDFPLDSYSILTLLTDLVRRISPETTVALKQDFLKQTRQGLAQLFSATVDPAVATAPSKRKRKHASVSVDDKSIFEQYPASTQRQLMGLLGLLQSPTVDTVSSLGIICARSGKNDSVSPQVEDFVVQVLHGIRKTLSMPSYLGFLVQSTGILNTNIDFTMNVLPIVDTDGSSSERTPAQGGNLVWSTDDSKLLLSFVRKIRRTSWYLTDCGSASKLLPMLRPVLTSWLDVSTSVTSPKLFALRARSAVAILAWISRDHLISCDESALLVILPEFEPLLVTAICRLLETLPTNEADDDDDENCRPTNSFLRPIIALLQNEPTLLKLIFSKQLSQLTNDAARVPQSSAALETLLLIVRDPIIREALAQFKQDVLEIAQSIETHVKGGPFESTSRSLRMYLETFR